MHTMNNTAYVMPTLNKGLRSILRIAFLLVVQIQDINVSVSLCQPK